MSPPTKKGAGEARREGSDLPVPGCHDASRTLRVAVVVSVCNRLRIELVPVGFVRARRGLQALGERRVFKSCEIDEQRRREEVKRAALMNERDREKI